MDADTIIAVLVAIVYGGFSLGGIILGIIKWRKQRK